MSIFQGLLHPIYLIDSVEKLQYLMLKAEHLRALQKFKEAYEVYQSIDEQKLFNDEQSELLIKKAFLLYLLGDMNKAKHHLSYIQDKSDPNYLMLKAMIEENAMNFEEASELLQKALNATIETKDTVLSAMIYSNYGRLRVIEGNFTDAISFYRQSYEIAKQQKNHELIHITFQNLIHTSISRGDKEKAMQYFQEYDMLISGNNLYDLMEKFNLRVEIARQNQSITQISEVITEGYQKIRSLLPNHRQRVFDASVLRMMYDNRMNLDIVMNRIYDNLNDYFGLEMPEKYFVLKEIYIPLIGIELPYCYKYALIRKQINEYMVKDASKEIDIYIAGLKDYEVYQRCNMERQKVIIQKECAKVYDFDNIYRLMVDIKDIYQKNGILIEELSMDLNIADECCAIENYSGHTIKPAPREKMIEHVEMAANGVLKLKKYPRVAEMNIRLATYYMILNDNQKAQEYFEAFEEAQVPIHHFAFWIQRNYGFLCSQFKANKRQGSCYGQ